MKNRAIWMVVPAVALGLGACNKKEETKAPDSTPAPAVAESTPQAPPPAPAPVMKNPALTPDERAAKLGFAKHLPQDTEVVMSFHNGSKAVDRIKASKLWKAVMSEMGLGMIGEGRDMEVAGEGFEEDIEVPAQDGEQDDDVQGAVAGGAIGGIEGNGADEEDVGPATLFGTEFTIALGSSTGEQTGNLLQFNSRSSYFQMRILAKALVDAAKSGDFSNFESALGKMNGSAMYKDLLDDPKSGANLLEKMSMPPLYVAFRTSEDDRSKAAQQVASLIESVAMFGENMVEPIEAEKGGVQFAGQKISGVKIAESMKEERSELDDKLDPATVDRLIDLVAKKDLVIVSGTLGDYVVLFVGATLDDLKFADSSANSLVATKALEFCDPYVSKDLAALIYGQKECLDKLMAAAGGLGDVVDGVRDGLAGSDGLGDTRDLEALLRMVGEREQALRQLVVNDALGMVAYFEDGMKIESYGGSDNGAIDWKASNTMASLGDSEDVVLFANMTSGGSYGEKARAYGEALVETAYAVASKISELPMEDEKMAQFKEGFKMFDSEFRPDVIALWDAYRSDFDKGLGMERALVIDLSGTMPAIPGVPQAVVDEAKFPRISMVAPVVDRTKLASSWQKMNSSITGILGKVSKMSGQDIPMQKPISSEKDGFSTWFFSMPFFNDDFMPSVTVGDKWFAASTSKNQALDLIRKADKGGTPATGLVFNVNFNTLRKFADESAGILEKNGDSLGLSEDDLAKARKIIAATEDLDKLTIHARREGGQLRSSIHFKTR